MASRFGSTWWGQAWIDALEGIAGGDTVRLGRGRTYARQGRAEDLLIEPGQVTAWVWGSRDDPYEVTVAIRAFRDDEWESVLDAIAAKAGHAAALLDGELDPGVVDDAEAVDVHLLPRARDLQTACSCPDDVDPCKHAAAVTYLMAEAIDRDPFVLLLVRGLRRDDVLDGVRSRRVGGDGQAAGTADVADRLTREQAWTRTLGPLPLVPPVGDRPGRPAAWPSEPPKHAPFTGSGLRSLINDAAHRAWELAAGATDAGLALDARADLARRAAGASPDERDRLAAGAEMAPVEVDALAVAWTHGGADAVRATEEGRWTPPPLEMAAARDLVVESGFNARRVHMSGNRITAEGRLQFRRSRDGHWYAFTKSSGRWELAAPPELDLEDLVLRDIGD